MQATDTTGTGSLRGELSGNGERIVFQSRGEHGSAGDNPDGLDGIWLWDVNDGEAGIVQVTDSPRSSFGAAINASGTRLAFSSFGDPTGGNPDGNLEVSATRRPRRRPSS